MDPSAIQLRRYRLRAASFYATVVVRPPADETAEAAEQVTDQNESLNVELDFELTVPVNLESGQPLPENGLDWSLNLYAGGGDVPESLLPAGKFGFRGGGRSTSLPIDIEQTTGFLNEALVFHPQLPIYNTSDEEGAFGTVLVHPEVPYTTTITLNIDYWPEDLASSIEISSGRILFEIIDQIMDSGSDVDALLVRHAYVRKLTITLEDVALELLAYTPAPGTNDQPSWIEWVSRCAEFSPPGACPPAQYVPRRWLMIRPLRIAASSTDGEPTGNTINGQVTEAKTIWARAAINIIPIANGGDWHQIVAPELKSAGSIEDFRTELNKQFGTGALPRSNDSQSIDIYFSSTAPNDWGGAVHVDPRFNAGYIIITDRNGKNLVTGAPGNPWLLAHELGHVFQGKHGTLQPAARAFVWDGAAESVMESSGLADRHSPGKGRNPLWNCVHANAANAPRLRWPTEEDDCICLEPDPD